MLFMVVENFRGGNAWSIGERFRRLGRMLPDGVAYHASWMDLAGTRCFQLMEAADRESLDGWINHWDDLVEFEITPVETASEFWAKSAPRD
jgi:hypothetical protein